MMYETYNRLQLNIFMFLGSILVIGILVSLAYNITTDSSFTGSIILSMFMYMGGLFAGIIMGLSAMGFGQYFLARASEKAAEVT